MKRICEICKKEYEWVRGKSKRFCCMKCIKEYKRLYPNGTEQEFKCLNCGKIYYVNTIKGNWDKNNNQINLKGKGSGNFVVKSSKYCCYECGQIKEKEKSIRTFRKNYGVDNPNKSKKVRDKIKQTCLEKYGTEYSWQAQDVKNKIKNICLEKYGKESYMSTNDFRNKTEQTNIKKYGTKNPIQNKEIKEKAKQTCLEKYGYKFASQADEIKEKTKQTNLERYGVDNYAKSDICKRKVKKTISNKIKENPNYYNEIHDKIKQVCLEKYGDENYKNTNKAKQTFIKNYGVDNPNKSKKIQNKIKQTNLKRYGVDSYSKSNYFKDKFKDLEWVKQIQEKVYNTKKLHIEEDPEYWNNIQEKGYNTRKLHSSFNSSKPEIEIYQKLTEKYGKEDIEWQYRSKKYPFNCDFYIKSKDLYIEYQGHWTHGGKPYDKDNLEHQKLVEKWENKLQEINYKMDKKNYYTFAIKVWTISDPKKRQVAKDNNINWVEFFNMEEFYNWYNKG